MSAGMGQISCSEHATNPRHVVSMVAGFVREWAGDLERSALSEDEFELEWILERLEDRAEWLREEIKSLIALRLEARS